MCVHKSTQFGLLVYNLGFLFLFVLDFIRFIKKHSTLNGNEQSRILYMCSALLFQFEFAISIFDRRKNKTDKHTNTDADVRCAHWLGPKHYKP